MSRACTICGNTNNNKTFQAMDMLRGSRNYYTFLECSSCGCVQLISPPEDMTDYYSNAEYGSFSMASRSKIKSILRKARNRQVIFEDAGLLGRLLQRFADVPKDYRIIAQYATRDSRIVDVGCGHGAYLDDLAGIGFKNLSGIDPFLDADVTTPNGVLVRKLYAEQLDEQFDVVLSHHSFEHVPNPLETLSAIRGLLKPKGVCLLTMPVVEDLYREYGANSYVLQAPQHCFLYSIRGMSIIAEKAGLKVDRVVRDAETTADWYRYSEFWKHNITNPEINAEREASLGPEVLGRVQNVEATLNTKGLGDNVTFVMSMADQESQS